MDHPYILLCDDAIDKIEDIMPILEMIIQIKVSLLIISGSYNILESLQKFDVNFKSAEPIIAVVMSLGFTENRKGILTDLAIVTGGEIIIQKVTVKKQFDLKGMLGRAEKIILDPDNTFIIKGYGDKSRIFSYTDDVVKVMNCTVSDYDREKIQERVDNLRRYNYARVCSACMNEIPENVKFCNHCGVTIETKTKRCSNSNCRYIPMDAFFCPDCGTRQKQRETSANTPVGRLLEDQKGYSSNATQIASESQQMNKNTKKEWYSYLGWPLLTLLTLAVLALIIFLINLHPLIGVGFIIIIIVFSMII